MYEAHSEYVYAYFQNRKGAAHAWSQTDYYFDWWDLWAMTGQTQAAHPLNFLADREAMRRLTLMFNGSLPPFTDFELEDLEVVRENYRRKIRLPAEYSAWLAFNRRLNVSIELARFYLSWAGIGDKYSFLMYPRGDETLSLNGKVFHADNRGMFLLKEILPFQHHFYPPRKLKAELTRKSSAYEPLNLWMIEDDLKMMPEYHKALWILVNREPMTPLMRDYVATYSKEVRTDEDDLFLLVNDSNLRPELERLIMKHEPAALATAKRIAQPARQKHHNGFSPSRCFYQSHIAARIRNLRPVARIESTAKGRYSVIFADSRVATIYHDWLVFKGAIIPIQDPQP